MQDNRIQSVDAFTFEVSGKKLIVKFTVYTKYGDVSAEKEVQT